MNTSKRWHVAAWPPLAWLETAIKLLALALGIAALLRALAAGGLTLPTGPTLLQFLILLLLSLLISNRAGA